ncbi:hypothetical protein ACLI4Z_11515 [Natrialbaceae archaeon A-arb3/5]
MPSTHPSRRRLLAGAGSCLAIGVAGCSGTNRSESAVNSVEEGGEPGPSDEYDLLTIRADDDSVFVYPQDDRPDEDEADRSRRPMRSAQFVTNEDEADALLFETIDAAASAEARAFLEDTDFETESVVIDQRGIEDCYRRHVLTVQAESDEFRTRYCRTLKSPTTPCEADRDVMEALFFRIQRAYDDAPSSRSSGESASCPDSVFEGDARANETASDGPENESADGAEDER